MRVVRRIISILLSILILLMLLYTINISNQLISRSNEQIRQMNHLEQEVVQINSKIIALPKPKEDKVQSTNNETKPSFNTVVIGALATLSNIFKNISIFSLTSR